MSVPRDSGNEHRLVGRRYQPLGTTMLHFSDNWEEEGVSCSLPSHTVRHHTWSHPTDECTEVPKLWWVGEDICDEEPPQAGVPWSPRATPDWDTLDWDAVWSTIIHKDEDAAPAPCRIAPCGIAPCSTYYADDPMQGAEPQRPFHERRKMPTEDPSYPIMPLLVAHRGDCPQDPHPVSRPSLERKPRPSLEAPTVAPPPALVPVVIPARYPMAAIVTEETAPAPVPAALEESVPQQVVSSSTTNNEAMSVSSHEQVDAAVAAQTAEAEKNGTTLMIRNIPIKVTQQMLLEIWTPDGSFDFLYLPFSFEKRRNLGYAFLNFVNHEEAIVFVEKWQHMFLPGHNKKSLEVGWAMVQGRDANLRQFLNYKISRIKNAHFQPVILDGCERLDFKTYLTSLTDE